MDKREDAGDFYPGGKVISTRPVATGGDVKHSDFAGLDVKTNTIPDLREAVRELGRRLGATVVTALSACVAVAATVQTVPVNDLDFDANPSIVTNVVFDAPPDFSTNNTALVETIEATAPAPGNYAAVSNRAMSALQSYTETDPNVPAWAKATSKPSYSWSEITSKPVLATVATSGSYNDLSNKPTIPTVPTAQINAATTTNALQDAAIESSRVSIASNRVNIASNAAAISTLTDTTSTLSDSISTLSDTTSTLRDSIPSVAFTNETLYVNGWKTNVVTRHINGAVVIGSHTAATRAGGNCLANGYLVDASGLYSHAEGAGTTAYGYCSHAEGANTSAAATGSHAEGRRASVPVNENYAWCWQGVDTSTYYNSHGPGTFNINPVDGVDGFWIGETNFAQHVRNIAGAGGGSAAPKRVAMFVIPVNEGRTTFTYKGFELKCSTNNFASAASESVKLQFYSQSEIADEGSGSTIDKMKLFACTSYWSDRDRRSYSPIGNTIDYHNDLYSVVALVDVSCLKRHPEDNGAWLNEDNEDLVWCYLRDTANDVEREELTTEPLWRPIAPVKWFRELPSWAR